MTSWTNGPLSFFQCDNPNCGRIFECVTTRAQSRYPRVAWVGDAVKMAATQCGWSFNDGRAGGTASRAMCDQCVTRPPWDIDEGVIVNNVTLEPPEVTKSVEAPSWPTDAEGNYWPTGPDGNPMDPDPPKQNGARVIDLD